MKKKTHESLTKLQKKLANKYMMSSAENKKKNPGTFLKYACVFLKRLLVYKLTIAYEFQGRFSTELGSDLCIEHHGLLSRKALLHLGSLRNTAEETKAKKKREGA